MHCLVITPKRFYVFHEFLTETLKSRGYKVSVVNEEYPENIIGVLLGNFIPCISRWLTLNFFKKYLSNGIKYDLVIIIKGRGVSTELITLLKKYSKRVVGYNFDSFKYNPSPLEWKSSVDKYATFDHLDSVEHGLEKVELFASIQHVEPTDKTIDLSVVLKNHSERLLYLERVSSLFPKIKCEVFIYERNLFTFLRNFLAHPLLVIKWRKYISFKPLDYQSYLGMISRSIFTLDFAHPKQTGTTIRCFEALACKTKIISNNRYIFENPAFNEKNAIIHSLDGDVDELYELIQKHSNIKSDFESRSINDFVDDLLANTT